MTDDSQCSNAEKAPDSQFSIFNFQLFEVTDLKQWTYCPRVLYYRYCLPDIRPVTDLMRAGIGSHSDEVGREEAVRCAPMA